MKTKIVVSSLLACAVATPGLVLAQEEVIEEIVVTGSLIRGTPEDAALPVEVHTTEDLQLSGAPTALEFAKTLTSQGPTTGEAYYFGGAGLTGNVQFNLRGLGADKTLTLFNGRRISQNTSVIPGIATQRIEVLKDGAAVTYGADATGGVVNFITRDSYEGVEVNASYKGYDGTDGEYDMALMTGFGGEDTNIIFAAEWEHRSEVDPTEREFSSLPYGVNPTPWSDLTNMAAWQPVSLTGFPPAGIDPGGFLTATPPTDFDQSSCEAVGGVYVADFLPDDGDPTTTGDAYNPGVCKYGYLPYYDLVADNDIYRLYGQVNSAVTDTMDFYMRVAYSRVRSPNVHGSPAQPVVRGPVSNSATFQFRVPTTNPYVADFAERSGWDQSPAFALTQQYRAFLYRGFAHGGNSFIADSGNFGTPSEIDNRYWHLSTGLEGEFNDMTSYDFAITYNHINAYSDAPDILGFRLQEAINGFGGPDCNATDLDADTFGTQNPAAAGLETNGCYWWNPFASSFPSQPELGLPNPAFDETMQNNPEVARWLFDKRAQEVLTETITMDFSVSGDTGVELPGGNIGWAAGVQWRQFDRREVIESEFYNGAQPCAWPDQEPANPDDTAFYTGCTPDEPGPFVFFDTNKPDTQSQDQRSAFFEFGLPVLDTLNFSVAGRYEEFSGDLDETVYKVSGKWQATDNLAFRAAYGTNYQAPPPDLSPGEVQNLVRSYTIANGNWRGMQQVTSSSVEPETATVWSAGFIWQSRGFSDDHDLQILLDYFDLETENEFGLLASNNDIANAVFSIVPPGETEVPTDGTAIADCSSPFIGRVSFNGTAGCAPGDTQPTANDLNSIRTEFGNGPNQQTSGVDLQVDYSMPLFAGDFSIGLTATIVTEDENGETILDGVVVDEADDRLGYLNFETVAFASSEYRANLRFNYAQDIHNFRFETRYISGVDDERYLNDDGSVNTASLVPSGVQPGTSQPFGPSDYGVKGDDWLIFDFHYNVDLEFASLSASIENLTDEDPPESRQEFGFDPRIGNALGRTFEVGIRKEF